MCSRQKESFPLTIIPIGAILFGEIEKFFLAHFVLLFSNA